MQQPKKLNSSWFANLLAQTSGFVFFLIATPFLIQSLGKDKFGALTLLFLIPQIIIQLDFGIVATGTRAMAMYQAKNEFQKRARIFWEVLLALSIIGVLQVFLFALFSKDLMVVLQLKQVLNNQLSNVVEATSFWFFSSLLGAGVTIAARAFERFKLLAIIQASIASLFWLGALVLAIINPDIVMILWWGGCVSVITTFALLFHVRKTVIITRDVFTCSSSLLLPTFFHFSTGAFIAQASSLLTYHTDKFLVSALISPSAVGIYNICANVASKILVFVSAIAAFAFPRAVRLHSQGSMDELSDVYLRATRVCVMAAALIAILIAGLAEPFLRLWLKSDYAPEYALVMALMALGYLFTAFSVVASNISIGMGRSKVPALFAIIGGSSTLLLCFYLAPKFGLYGAVVASVIGMSQALVFNWIIARSFGRKQAGQSFLLAFKSILVWCVATLSLMQFNYLIISWFLFFLSAILLTLIILSIWFFGSFAKKDEREFVLKLGGMLKWW